MNVLGKFRHSSFGRNAREVRAFPALRLANLDSRLTELVQNFSLSLQQLPSFKSLKHKVIPPALSKHFANMFKSAVAALALFTGVALGQSSSAAASASGAAAPATNGTLRFLNPVSGTTWMYSQNQTIMWSAPGPSDPQNISLLIANVYNNSILCVISEQDFVRISD